VPSETLKRVLRPRILVMNILWFALTLTILLYVGLAYFLNPEGQSAQPVENSLRLALYLIAGSTAVLSLLLRSRSLSEGRIYDKLKEEVDPQALATNSETGEIDQERLKIIKSLTPLEMKAAGLSGMYFTTMLISLAMNEAVALFGMLLAVLERRPEPVIPFAVAGLALNLLIFPRFTQFIDKTMAKYPQAGRYSGGF
jgi:hypothetical protein